MLSKRPLKTLAEAVRKVGERNFIIEEKLDGERIQLHKRGAEYFYCSRRVRLYISLLTTDRRIQEGKGLHVPIWTACRRRILDTLYRRCFRSTSAGVRLDNAVQRLSNVFPVAY